MTEDLWSCCAGIRIEAFLALLTGSCRVHYCLIAAKSLAKLPSFHISLEYLAKAHPLSSALSSPALLMKAVKPSETSKQITYFRHLKLPRSSLQAVPEQQLFDPELRAPLRAMQVEEFMVG